MSIYDPYGILEVNECLCDVRNSIGIMDYTETKLRALKTNGASVQQNGDENGGMLGY